MLYLFRQLLKGQALLGSSTAVEWLAAMRALGSRQALQQHICQTDSIRTCSSSAPALQRHQSAESEPALVVNSADQKALEQSQLEQQQEQSVLSSSSEQPLPAAYGPRKVAAKSKVAGVQKREGVVHVNSTMNNTIMVLTDRDHKVQTWTSGGTIGYKNANKATPMAAELAAKELAKRAVNMGFHSVVVKLKGMGKNKQFAVQSLAANGLTVTQLWDVTPISYNGCRLPRRRRV